MADLRRRLPPLRSLLAFEAAARLGSFTAAAAELFVSQPAVSRQIRALERQLGLSLFEREHKGVCLSEAGQRYYEGVVSALAHIADTGERLRRGAAPPRLTLYANYGMATYWLLPRLSNYLAEHPDQDVVIKTVEADRRLRAGRHELALRFGRGQWRDGEVHQLFRERAFVVASPAYLDSAPPLRYASDLYAHRLLRMEQQPDGWVDWSAMMRALGAPPAPLKGPVYNNYTLAVQAALAGQGLAIGWAQICDDFLERGWLVRPLTQSIETDKAYYVVAGADALAEPSVRQLHEWLLSQSQVGA